tara:strand:- start:3490 stop:3711 length:222 start_codon:yes stop_codon:yes gene_type:complete
MNTVRREQLEMAGYQQGRSGGRTMSEKDFCKMLEGLVKLPDWRKRQIIACLILATDASIPHEEFVLKFLAGEA